MREGKFERSRLPSIDLLRGIAVAIMVARHAADVVLLADAHNGALWRGFDVTAGFVAPLFLLLAGMTLGISLRRHRDVVVTARRHMMRGAGLIALGMALQLPILSIRQLVWVERHDYILQVFSPNILQVIGTGIVVCALLYRLTPVRARALAGLLASLAIIITPLIGLIDISVPLPLAAWFRSDAAVAFIPFIAYPLVGFAVGPALVERGRVPAARIAVGGVLMIGFAFAVDYVLGAAGVRTSFWGASVQQVMFRLGGILTVMGGVNGAIAWIERRTRPVAVWVRGLGRDSLGVYVLHVMVLYGSPLGPGLSAAVGGRLGAAQTAAMAALVLAATWGAVAAWRLLRERHPVPTSALRDGAFALLAAVLLMKP